MNPPVQPPEKVPEAVSEAMQRLRYAGAINGLMLCRSTTPLVQWFPYPDSRTQATVSIIHELTLLLRNHERRPDSYLFRLREGCILALVNHDLRLILLHSDPRETVTIRAIASTVIDDLEQLLPSPTRAAPRDPSPKPAHSVPSEKTDPKSSAEALPETAPIPIAPEPSSKLGRIIHPDRTHTWFRGAPKLRPDGNELKVEPE